MNHYKIVTMFLHWIGSDVIPVLMQSINRWQKFRNQPPLPIEPAPIFIPVPLFNLRASVKKPVLCQVLAAELKIMAGKRVYPKFNRQLQPLESYAGISEYERQYAR